MTRIRSSFIGIGFALGAVLGVAVDNLALGIAIALGLGIAIGSTR